MPEHLAKQLAQIRKAVANKKACRLIQCKRLKTPSASDLRPKTTENKLTKTDTSIELPLSKIAFKSTEKKEPRDEPDTVTVIAVKTKAEDNATSKSPPENQKTDKNKKGDKKSTKTTTSLPKLNLTKTQSTEIPIILSFIPSF